MSSFLGKGAAWLRDRILAPGRRARAAALGRRGERVAASYLRARGLRVVARNLRCGGGEIDLVAIEGSTVVFVEVKSRGPGSWSSDLEKIHAHKRRALRRACHAYLRRLEEGPGGYRVDAVTVDFAPGRWGLRPRELRWYPAVLDLDGHTP